jgi:predicted SAM-dependent methyltransferase
MTLDEKLKLPYRKVDWGCGNEMHEGDLSWIRIDGDDKCTPDIVCDIRNVPIKSGTVDEIFCRDVIEHFPVWMEHEFWDEINRVMKIGGV